MTLHYDAIVIGAGFSGIYMTYKLRQEGYSVKGFEKASTVGGVWYWSRYPGAKCDSESIYYNFTFSKELYQKWSWSSRYAAQDEILRYLNFAAEELDVKKEFSFNTTVQSAVRNEIENKWEVQTEQGDVYTCTYLITAVGCLSSTNIPNMKGLEKFEGQAYHTGEWPHNPVNLTGKRVGVIGTGSSGVQSIPEIAKVASELFVFQRTPQFTSPANNYEFEQSEIDEVKRNFDEIREQMIASASGLPTNIPTKSALEETPEVRQKVYEEGWEKGGFAILNAYNDLLISAESNQTVGEFIREKIKDIVKDPKKAEGLLPYYYYGTKRPIVNTNYYETYNFDHVHTVNLREQPIDEITKNGIRTTKTEYDLDVIIFATGYDAMTRPLMKIDIRGKEGKSIREVWEDGATTETYLGLSIHNFPNLFTITGPQSPSVLTNMPAAIEQHVDWITEIINYMRIHQYSKVEATLDAQKQWSDQCAAIADQTLFTKTESWYTGANIEGKPRGMLIYVGGLKNYREICDDVAAKGYEGYTFEKVNVETSTI